MHTIIHNIGIMTSLFWATQRSCHKNIIMIIIKNKKILGNLHKTRRKRNNEIHTNVEYHSM